MYKIYEYNRLGADLNKLPPELRCGFKERFIDNLLTAILGRWIIDIERFDKYLHELYGNYENKGLSMRDLIESEMGINALKLIENLL